MYNKKIIYEGLMAASTATAFQQVAQKQDPAVFDYEREVVEVWHDFPDTKGKVFFVDLCAQRKLVYPDTPEKREVIREWASN